MTPEEQKMYKDFAVLGAAGLVAGLGSLLASKETLTLRIVVGRAISSVTLGVAAASGLALYPDMAFPAQVGIACLVASLGTSSLERILQGLKK